MVWFKIDDGWWAHPKVLSVSDRAIALWARAGSWSSQQLTGGHVPATTLRLLGASKATAEELVAAKLWLRDGNGYKFHDWAVYNFDADSVQAKRDAESEGARRGNHLRWHVNRGITVQTCDLCVLGNPESASDARSGGDQVPDGLPESPPNPPDPYPTQSLKRVIEGGERKPTRPTTPTPFCFEHMPAGPDGAKCGACADARRAWEAAGKPVIVKPTLLPRPVEECAEHPGYPLPCDRCVREAVA